MRPTGRVVNKEPRPSPSMRTPEQLMKETARSWGLWSPDQMRNPVPEIQLTEEEMTSLVEYTYSFSTNKPATRQMGDLYILNGVRLRVDKSREEPEGPDISLELTQE